MPDQKILCRDPQVGSQTGRQPQPFCDQRPGTAKTHFVTLVAAIAQNETKKPTLTFCVSIVPLAMLFDFALVNSEVKVRLGKSL